MSRLSATITRDFRRDRFLWRIILPIVGLFLALGCICTLVLINFPSSDQSALPQSDVMVDVVFVDIPLAPGDEIRQLYVYQGSAPISQVPEGAFQRVEEVYGKYVRYPLDPGDFVTADVVLDDLTVDVLVTTAALPQGAIISPDDVEVRTVQYSDLYPMEPLMGLDYYYLGQMVALVPVEPGTTLSREIIAFEPLVSYESILQTEDSDSLEQIAGNQFVVQSREQVLDIAGFSLLGVLLSFLLGVGFVLLINLLFGRPTDRS